jgi:ADP-heptose:LPS heptosyltransferase
MDDEFFSTASHAARAQAATRHEIGETVLLIAASHTGNNVFCTPAIRLLKRYFPQTVFDVVALNRQSAEVFRGNPDVRHCHVANRAWQLRLLAQRYDSVICLHPKSQHLMQGLKARAYVLPEMVDGRHHADQMLAFASALAGVPVEDGDRAYVLPPADAESRPLVDAYLDTPGSRYVGLHLGCGRTSIHGWKFFYKQRATHPKLWPAERYTELAQRLVESDPAMRIVLTGTGNEAFLGKALARMVPGTINLIGKTSIAELHHLMNRLDLFITHDCGVMHIAAATEVPMICLFGPTDPVFTGPYPLRRERVLIRRASMEAISVDEILQTVQSTFATKA